MVKNYFVVSETNPRRYDLGQMFTPPKNKSVWDAMWFGGNGGKKEEPSGAPAAAPEVAAPAAEQPSDIGTAQGFDSAENQAARRRLARMSKYFTSPTGILDSPTGSAGVF